jgi:hypothetical protein
MSRVEHIEEPEIDFPPEYRNYLIYCAESGIDSQQYQGWGTLWIPAERRGDLAHSLRELKRKHVFQGEVKWGRVGYRNAPFFRELCGQFFRTNWMMFHCVVFRTAMIRPELFEGGGVEARLHRLSALLENKIDFFSGSGTDKIYHVRVGPLLSSHAEEDEKAGEITNAQLRQALGHAPIRTMLTRNSRESAGVQIADFLLGAVLASWNERVADDGPKAGVLRHVAKHLGWEDLQANTRPLEWKFNVWYQHEPEENLPGSVRTRDCNYLFPVQPYRRTPK